MLSNCSWREWCVTLDHEDITARDVLASMEALSNTDIETPLIVQLIENPKFDIPGIELFNGSVDITAHDFIHALLGRGLLPKDEAFVIGFTMGSTNRVTTLEQRMYSLVSKYFYPGPYKFDDADLVVFKKAAHLGYVSNCMALNQVDYESLLDLPLKEARQKVGIEVDLIKAYYRMEEQMYPDCVECQRLFLSE